MASGFDHRRPYGFSRNQDQFPSHDDFTMANDRRRRTEAERQRQDARPSRGHSRGYGEVHNFMMSTVDSDPTITGARRKTFPPQQRGYTGREQRVSSGRYVPHQRRMEDRSYGTHRETGSYARRFHAPTCTGTDHTSRPPAFETRSGFERGSRGNDELTSGYGKQKHYRTDFKRRPLDNRTASSHWRGERGRHNRVPRTRAERTPDEESDFRRYSTSFFTTTERSENEATRNPSSDSSNTRPSNDSIAEPHQTPENTSDQMVSSEPYRVKPASTTPALTEKQLQSFLEDKPSDILNELIRKKDACMALLCQDQIDDNTIELILQVLSALCNLDPLSAYTEELNTVLAMVESSLFLSKHVTRFLVGFIVKEQEEVDDNDHDIRRLTMVLKLLEMFLQHKPSRYCEVGGALILLEKIVTSSSLLEDLKQLKIAYEAVEQAQRSVKQRAMEKPPPNNFRDIKIFPESSEIRRVTRPFLRKNIIEGRYESVEHYLDVQFRLLREDFVAPLREGVTEFLSDTNGRIKDIRIYDNVFIRSETMGENGFVYTLEFARTPPMRRIRWEASKRLLYGSFVCLTKDKFQHIICATVENREVKDLEQGKLGVRFLTQTKNLSRGPYIMAESAAYFEACRHVLHGLQQIDEDNFPFTKYIVDVTSIVDPPEYLHEKCSVVYDLSLLAAKSSSPAPSQIQRTGDLHRSNLLAAVNQTKRIAFNVSILEKDTWPGAQDLCLDESQKAAVQTALTKEFVLIQGPPGTGKTYVGLKIVQLLLHNRCRVDNECIASSPILVVCYTNHALDQFLEGIHDFGELEIVRVGSRSNSKLLEDKNLSQLRRNKRKKRGRERREVDWISNRLRDTDERIRRLLLKLELPRKVLLNVRALQNYMSHSEFSALLIQQRGCNEPQEEPQKLLDWLGVTEEEKEDKMIEQQVFQENAAYDAGCNKRCGKNRDLDPVMQLKKPDMMTDDQASEVERVWSLKIWDRWRLYRFWVRKYLEYHKAELQRQRQAHDDICKELQAVNMQNDVSKENGLKEQTDSKEVEKTKSRLRETDKMIFLTLLKIELPTKVLLSVKALRKYMSRSEYGALLIQHQEGMKPQENPQKLLNWLGVIDVSENINVEDEGRRIQMERQIDEGGDFCTIREERLQAIEQETLRENAAYDLQCYKRCGKNRDVIPVVELQKPDVMSDKEASGVNRVWSLKISDRWRLYRLWVRKYLEDHEAELQRQRQVYEDLSEKLQDFRSEEDLEILREANIIGMTTTGAAKYRAVLQRLRPGIVVVEEAAEVLEAHIITTLTAACQHLILIGDHQQLKPNPTVYRLARQFNLDTSLFERMINNGVPCNTLSHQHRMRPEISSLMKKHFYNNLHDDESVLKMDDIKGVKHNMFFIDHQHFEDETDDNKTKSNRHEALFLVGLCKYFLQQGYKPSQITVLTAYTGQLFCFRRLMDRNTFDGVRVCVVDNFQGEENDIILLSLVRSNEKGSIGFLSTSNRVCVALSRARIGFYCIGNVSILKKAEKWREISTSLQAEKRIGTSLPLVCQNHQDKITEVESGEDFKKVPLGGCGVPCEYRLPCGHVCDLLCHPLDPNHEKYKCEKSCPKDCGRQHPCPLQCFEGCKPCDVKLTKTMSDCGHVIQVFCYEFDTITCPMPCPRLYADCGHRCRKLCGENCLQTCPEECERKLLCGHSCRNPCGDPCTDYCEVQVERTLTMCGHTVRMDCGEKQDEHLCKVKVWRNLPKCDHRTEMFCHDDPDTAKCIRRCEKVLECGHQCKNKCFQNCQEMCLEDCKRALSCGHPCAELCSSSCTTFCRVTVERTLTECGHTVYMDCGEKSDDYLCEEKVWRVLPKCDHRVEMYCHTDPGSILCKKSCDRVLECGHPCPKKCYQNCQKRCLVQCERALSCGHPCKNVCGDPCTKYCEVEVERTLRKCGHTVYMDCGQKPDEHKCRVKVWRVLPKCNHRAERCCYRDPGSIHCRESCERVLECGHPCQKKCYQDCQECCPEKCERTLSCGHPCQNVCSDPCTKTCKVQVRRTLPKCGHTVRMACGEKPGEHQCTEKVYRDLPKCDHRAEMLCFQNPDSFECKERCEKVLECGHRCPNVCGKPCTVSDLSRPEFTANLFFYRLKRNIKPCEEPVKKTYTSCGHTVTVPCHKDLSSVPCTSRCELLLSCGHRCPNVCGKPCDVSDLPQLKKSEISNLYRRGENTKPCEEPVEKTYTTCGHTATVPCHRDISSVPCLRRCELTLPCGHQCPRKCGQSCLGERVDDEIIYKDNSAYTKYNSTYFLSLCQEKCKRELPCGHKCPNKCGEPCPQVKPTADRRMNDWLGIKGITTQCQELVKKKLPNCDHIISVRCPTDVRSFSCTKNCERVLPCGHRCPNKCIDPCPGSAIFKSNRFKRSKNYRQRAGPRERCEVTVTKARACGHSFKTMPCWKAEQAAKMPCKEPCRAELRCGHACTGNCHDCQQGSRHKPCTKNCTKQLLCGHMCGFECSKICSQDCRKCSDDHRQTKSRDSAASPSPSCKHNITHHHLKTKTCIRPCDRKLQCKHPCIGVCNEPCPPYCSVCSKKSVRSNLPKGSPIRPRDLYIYLPNCKHLCEMRTLDRMFTTVKNTLEKDYFLIRPVPCPKCKEPIRHCSRYNGILQTVTKSVNTARQICARSRRGDVGTTPLSFASGKWMRCRQGHVFLLEEENEVVGRQKEPRCSECSQKNG
ncbi:NFX1-type zinc finger-containing protein 1-like isoform X2 [Acanthaster planci]|nr:NFX1-type zinc finger-containing protein 1-like isoform X2 [Acanthaster planci]XP_022092095.1 NFX1-type zinc finger-containing protein 1-like isoform X2 [Acanthaster planci]XP_022092096.1 NFX1-type zinc finger-containing protein 1-like isoform X2 [Acanthaster planci]XP_022092097.1 NFX1-type zinc finger-containing protein 1-like isoform X2 [Acanthaster planci]